MKYYNVSTEREIAALTSQSMFPCACFAVNFLRDHQKIRVKMQGGKISLDVQNFAEKHLKTRQLVSHGNALKCKILLQILLKLG